MSAAENDVSVLPIFILPGQVVFPYERVTLDARTGANIALFATLQSRAFSEDAGTANKPALFAIARDLDSRIGTVAAIDVNAPKPSWVGSALRLRALSLFPYDLVDLIDPEDEHEETSLGSWPLYRGFLLCRVKKRCDWGSPHVPFNSFPFIGSCARANVSLPSKRTRTRSRSRSIAKPISSGVRSSLLAVSARSWAAFDENALLKRLHTAAVSNERILQLDDHLMASTPRSSDTPAKWSYWFAAALSQRLSEAQQIELLEERIPALRLRILLGLYLYSGKYLRTKQTRQSASSFRSNGGKRLRLGSTMKTPALASTGLLLLEQEKSSSAVTSTALILHPLPTLDENSFSKIPNQKTRL